MRSKSRWVASAAVFLAAAGVLPAAAGPGGPRHRSPARALQASAPCATPARGVQFYAPGRGRTVALTFDDGPGPTTPAIIDVLRREHVPATFFNLGVAAIAHPDLVRAEAADGFAVGDHTWDHPVLPQLSAAGQSDQMRREGAEQASILGSRPCLFRPPYGSFDGATTDAAAAQGMAVWNWSVDTEDWKAQGSGAQSWVQRIVSRAEAGASQRHPVILMHNQASPNPATLAALPTVIRYYKARGFEFVDLYGRTTLQAATTEVAASGGLVDLSVRRNSGLYVRGRPTGAGWSSWRRIGHGVGGGIAAAATQSGAAVVVARRTNGSLAIAQLRAGRLGRWHELGGRWVGRPAVTVSLAGVVSVVARGLDDSAWLRQWIHGRWGAWRSLGGHLVQSPAVAATHAGLTVVGVDTRGTVIARRLTRSGWGSWRSLGGAASAVPALLASASGDQLLLAVRTPAGNVAVRPWSSRQGWDRWRAVPGAIDSDPGLVLDRGTVWLIAARSDGTTVIDAWTGSRDRWRGWRRQA